MDPETRDPASYRDPTGHVHIVDGRVFRTVLQPEDFEFVRSTQLLERLAERGTVIPATLVQGKVLGAIGEQASHVLEHPKLDFISYPYEWPFLALKAAAILTLDIHREALDAGVTLSDSSAYNVQFVGARPLFIDYLSFRRYREGEIWWGHRQFCEQFLNPLLLSAYTGVPYHPWYRGAIEGISPSELSPLLPFRRRLSWKVAVHVGLQARFQRSTAVPRAARLSQRKLPLTAFKGMLESLRAWVSRLSPKPLPGDSWADYTKTRSYDRAEEGLKRQFVEDFVREVKPGMLWDLGCNTGEFAQVAHDSGAAAVIGFDADHAALNVAFARAQDQQLNFLPLYLDAANPSPNQGWCERERRGFGARADADAVLCLAFVHHLVITRNVPLDQLIPWVIDLAPEGVIEFVPKTDPMVRQMLRLREDIFSTYTEADFLQSIKLRAKVVRSTHVTETGRFLVWFRRLAD